MKGKRDARSAGIRTEGGFRTLLRVLAILSLIWTSAAAAQAHALIGHLDAVNAVAFSPDAKAVASGGLDGAVKLWDVSSGRELRTWSGGQQAVLSVAFSPDGRLVASCGAGGAVRISDVAAPGGASATDLGGVKPKNHALFELGRKYTHRWL